MQHGLIVGVGLNGLMKQHNMCSSSQDLYSAQQQRYVQYARRVTRAVLLLLLLCLQDWSFSV
jgi:hypothetical protein